MPALDGFLPSFNCQQDKNLIPPPLKINHFLRLTLQYLFAWNNFNSIAFFLKIYLEVKL